MAKRIEIPSYRSGTVSLVISTKFVYEVTLYKIYKDRVECIGSKYYISDKPIKFTESKYVKMKDYTLAKYVDWLAAPQDYIENNNFKLVTNDGGKRRNRKSNKS